VRSSIQYSMFKSAEILIHTYRVLYVCLKNVFVAFLHVKKFFSTICIKIPFEFLDSKFLFGFFLLWTLVYS
jgi:hypothetical protein